jgi:beta-phosphoglucomutase-like phosphatase (HAD superfamily)
VVEDAPNGVEAARAAGCRCIGVTNTTAADRLAAADRIVGSLSEVRLGDLLALLSTSGPV